MANPSTFKQEDYADFRLNFALRRVGQKILLRVLKFAIPKDDSMTYHDYFKTEGNFSYKSFDTSQKGKLKKDRTGESFDITLIYKLLIHGCPKVYPQSDEKWKTPGEFDYYIGRIKKTRNDIVHSASPIPYRELEERIQRLKELFVGVLETGKDRLGIPENVVDESVQEIERDFSTIISSPLSQTEVDEYLVTEGILESKVRYKNLSHVNPVDFFVGLELCTRIDDIFVSLEIKELENFEERQSINLNHLLKYFVNNDTSILILEGLAGSGKTTLSKYILSQWVEGSSSVYGLNTFTFILYLQCNNIYINSIFDLIVSIIPETSRRFQKEELIESLLCQKLLIIVDGIDEAHQGTRSVLKELFHRGHAKNIKFICTSRPEKVHWVYRVKGELSCGALSVVGIAKENRNAFIQKLHSYYASNLHYGKICPLNKVVQTLEKLSSTSIINDLKLPLFLALFTYLCSVQPYKMDGLNSVVSLYEELISALRDKLLTRSLSKNENSASPKDEDEVEDVITECFDIFCDEALTSLVLDHETLSKESLTKIKRLSSTIGLNVKDILSAFLVVKIVLTPVGIEEIVGFPHKGLKEYLAAKAAVNKVTRGQTLLSIFNVEKSDQTNVGDAPKLLDLDTGLMKYQNLILYLSGIMTKDRLLHDDHVNEILKLFRKAGVYLPRQWLALLVSLDYHFLACEFILMKFKKLEIEEDFLDTFIALLKYGCPKEVILTCDSAVSLKLKKVLSLLMHHNCNLKLRLLNYLKEPRNYSKNDILNVLSSKNRSCHLTWYEGTADERGIKSLPHSMRVLFLAVGTSDQAMALSALKGKSDIFFLKVHIERCVDPQCLSTPLEARDLFLFLSGVQATDSDVTWVTDVASRISSSKKYSKILFPASELNSKTLFKLLSKLEKIDGFGIGRAVGDGSGVSQGGFFVSSSAIKEAEEKELKKLCSKTFQCRFALMSDEEIWSR